MKLKKSTGVWRPPVALNGSDVQFSAGNHLVRPHHVRQRDFKTAVKLPLEQRQAYLDEACGSNHELRREVESLLRASDTADGCLEKPAADPNVLSPTVDVQPLTETSGGRIGPYKLL